MQQVNNPYPLMISVVVTSAAQLAAVYALLGSTAAANDLATGNASAIVAAPTGAGEQSGPSAGAEASQAVSGDDGAAALEALKTANGENTAEVDAHGHPWSPELHASTKGKTKDGLWRMKVGVTRPDPLPGFPVDSSATSTDTGTAAAPAAPSATSPGATDQGSGQPATSGDDDDEFAAFRAAAAASDAVDQAAAAAVAPRTYSDADLGALCNQAAVKLGDPAPIKEIITRYTPEGQVSHSRNIPEDKRADFVKEVEAKAGIEFVG